MKDFCTDLETFYQFFIGICFHHIGNQNCQCYFLTPMTMDMDKESLQQIEAVVERVFDRKFDEKFSNVFQEKIEPRFRLHTRYFEDVLHFLGTMMGDIRDLQSTVSRIDEKIGEHDIKIPRLFQLYPDLAAEVEVHEKRIISLEQATFPNPPAA